MSSHILKQEHLYKHITVYSVEDLATTRILIYEQNELSKDTIDKTETEYMDRLQPNHTYILDCANIKYLDNSGVALLIWFKKNATSKSCPVYILNLQNQPKKLLTSLELDTFLVTKDNLDTLLEKILLQQKPKLKPAHI